MELFLDIDSRSVDFQLARLNALLSGPLMAAFMHGVVVEHFQDKFDDNFRSESSSAGRWLPLSEVTIEDRMNQGFGPGPINVRTGELREFTTQSPGKIRSLPNLIILTYPGKATGELGRKVMTAQRGGTFNGQRVPARPIIEAGHSDLLYVMSAVNFFLKTGG